jgi:DNA-binding transcriptional ArsR family regulator
MNNSVVYEINDSLMNNVLSELKKSDGMTITELVKKTKLSRSSLRTALAKLDGAGKVAVRVIGMAKIYTVK